MCRRRGERISRKRGKDSSSSKGFTLIEILLVIGLVALMSGFLLTDWGNVAEAFGRQNWRESTQEAFRRGHFLAETRGDAVRLRFDPERREFVLESGDGGDRLESLGAEGILAVRMLRGEGFQTGQNSRRGLSVVFGADGTATPVRLEVEHRAGVSVFQNHPFSGRLIDGSRDLGPVAFSDW